MYDLLTQVLHSFVTQHLHRFYKVSDSTRPEYNPYLKTSACKHFSQERCSHSPVCTTSRDTKPQDEQKTLLKSARSTTGTLYPQDIIGFQESLNNFQKKRTKQTINNKNCSCKVNVLLNLEGIIFRYQISFLQQSYSVLFFA